MKSSQLSKVIASARAAFLRAGINIENKILSQSFLRLEVALVSNQSNYEIPILVNERAGFSTEKRLKQQDTFFISEIGVFVAAPASATDTAFKLLTYPSPTAFTGPEALALETLYNGQLTLDTNNRTVLAGLDILRHKVAPNTQATGAANSPIDEVNGSDTGFFEVLPHVALVGTKDNKLNVILPSNISTVKANSRLVLMLRGVLAQNTTIVQ